MNWQILSASVIGSSHLRNGLPCQDAHALRILPGGEILCAVADGLGSAPLAEQGAQLAVQVALDSLSDAMQSPLPAEESEREALIHKLFATTRSALEEKSNSDNRPLRDYATTLMVTIITQDWMAAAHLGDGAVVAQMAGEALFTLSAPQRGEYANETTPLTSPTALESVRYQAKRGELQAVALFTDGLQNLCLDAANSAPYEPFFAPLFAQLAAPLQQDEAGQALTAFLQSERICKRSDDDKTLVLMRRM